MSGERPQRTPEQQSAASREQEAFIEGNKQRLIENSPALFPRLTPQEGSLWMHAAQMSGVKKLDAAKLESLLVLGLQSPDYAHIHGTAKRLENVKQPGGADAVFQRNVDTLSRPHKNAELVLLLRFPELTQRQKMEQYRLAVDENEHVDESYFFRAGKDGTFVNPKYIEGFIDLSTGKFTSREDGLRQTAVDKR